MLVLLAVLGGAGYLIHCWIWPFRACRACGGTGRSFAPGTRRAWRACRRCKGNPTRLRAGRRFLNALSTYRDR